MNENQVKTIVAKLLSEGVKLNDIQKQLSSEHSHTITFMDLRLLAAELEVNWAQFDPKKEEKVEEEKEVPVPVDATLVEVSNIQRAGVMVHGTVTFLAGHKGEWFLDPQGQLGLKMLDDTVQPSESDMADFQQVLRQQLQG